MKSKWIFYSFFIIAFVVLAISFIIIGLCVIEKTDWFIVALTAVLAFTTALNAIITRGLWKQSEEAFKQSEEAFKQSKRALESSIFREIVSSTLQLNAILRNDWYFKDKEERDPYIENSVAGMLIALKNVDLNMFEKISEAIKTWNKTDDRTPATIFLKALNMVEKGISVE